MSLQMKQDIPCKAHGLKLGKKKMQHQIVNISLGCCLESIAILLLINE
jgi:hypothetical protein